MFNIEIREKIKRAGVYGYEVAAAYGVSETSFSRMLSRSELTEEQKEGVLNAIGRLLKEREVTA